MASCGGKIEKPNLPPAFAPPEGTYSAAKFKADWDTYNANPTADVRNRIVYGLLGEIDFAFYDYETALFLKEGNFHVGADFVQLGLAAASTVSPAARTKTILGALLTGTTGLNLSIDKNYFRQQTVQAITSSMEAARDKIKAQILLQLKNDVTAYPFALARADLIHYFFAGTLNGGLQNLTQTAAADAQTQRAAADSVQVAGFSKADVDCTQKMKTVFFKDRQDKNLTPIIGFLRAMGVTIGPDADAGTVTSSFSDLGFKILNDTSLRAKYCDEAGKEGLIQ